MAVRYPCLPFPWLQSQSAAGTDLRLGGPGGWCLSRPSFFEKKKVPISWILKRNPSKQPICFVKWFLNTKKRSCWNLKLESPAPSLSVLSRLWIFSRISSWKCCKRLMPLLPLYPVLLPPLRCDRSATPRQAHQPHANPDLQRLGLA